MESEPLKVLSYNIHKGFSTQSRFTLRAIREVLREVHPDLIFLQEVVGEHEGHSREINEWPDQSQFEFLADEIWPHFAYGRNAVYSAGHHGNAILSKFPIFGYENIDISTNRVEKRGLLHAVIGLPLQEKPLHAICVHLGLLEADRARQIHRICDRIDSHVPHGDPLILGGDFNDWRGQASNHLEKRLDVKEVFMTLTGNHARTFPSWLPALRLDRIYLRGLQAARAKCLTGKPWRQLSDHIALFAEMQLQR